MFATEDYLPNLEVGMHKLGKGTATNGTVYIFRLGNMSVKIEWQARCQENPSRRKLSYKQTPRYKYDQG